MTKTGSFHIIPGMRREEVCEVLEGDEEGDEPPEGELLVEEYEPDEDGLLEVLLEPLLPDWLLPGSS